MTAFKYSGTMIECSRRCVCQLSHENECEGLLPDCRVGVKESKSEVECIGSTHSNLLSVLNYGDKSDDRVTRQAASDRQQDVLWLRVHAWHDRSYIARISLLA